MKKRRESKLARATRVRLIALEAVQAELKDTQARNERQRETIEKLQEAQRMNRAELARVTEQADLAYPIAEVLKITNERLYENIVDFARAWARRAERLGPPQNFAAVAPRTDPITDRNAVVQP